jgi:hypothetical protein
MSRFAVTDNTAVTDISTNASDNANRFLTHYEDGTLFNVQLNPAMEPVRIDQPLPGLDGIKINTACRHVMGKRFPGDAMGAFQITLRQQPEHRP